MAKLCKNFGFSLTEVLLSVGTLAVGMIFIAGVFPVAIHFTTVATEQTVAAVVADEAFAKIRIYAIGELDDLGDDIRLNALDTDKLTDFNDVLDPTVKMNAEEFAYPSDPCIGISQKQYFWSALCRLTEGTLLDPNPPVQATVFVCRKTNANLRYFNSDCSDDVSLPVPVKINVREGRGSRNNELEITETDKRAFINDGCTIVDDRTGRLYRVLKRYPPPDDEIILLDRDWDYEDWEGSTHDPEWIWVVPPPLSPGSTVNQMLCSGKNPCVAIYQRVIRF